MTHVREAREENRKIVSSKQEVDESYTGNEWNGITFIFEYVYILGLRERVTPLYKIRRKEKESEEPSRADKTGDSGRLPSENDFADVCCVTEVDVCRCQQNFLWNLPPLNGVSRQIIHVNGRMQRIFPDLLCFNL